MKKHDRHKEWKRRSLMPSSALWVLIALVRSKRGRDGELLKMTAIIQAIFRLFHWPVPPQLLNMQNTTGGTITPPNLTIQTNETHKANRCNVCLSNKQLYRKEFVGCRANNDDFSPPPLSLLPGGEVQRCDFHRTASTSSLTYSIPCHILLIITHYYKSEGTIYASPCGLWKTTFEKMAL